MSTPRRPHYAVTGAAIGLCRTGYRDGLGAFTLHLARQQPRVDRRRLAGHRFYALYDKISRDDILVHAYAQYRSKKGAPGVDGQEFADVRGVRGATVAR